MTAPADQGTAAPARVGSEATTPAHQKTTDRLGMGEVADVLGLHYDTLRQSWRAWATPGHPDYRAFPYPFRYPPPGRKGRRVWRRSAIDDWKLARERALGPGRAQPETYRADRVADQAAVRATPQLDKQRAALAQLMERA